MEISIKSILLLGSVIFTGLSAGLFFAWSLSVIPGTLKISDSSYLEVMQSINRAILNPAFFLIFFGSVVMLSVGSIYLFHGSKPVFWLMLAASATYLVGTLAVTGLGNVPLNDQLEALKLSELNPTKMQEFREYYETNWNRLHRIRTLSAIAAFILSTVALWINTRP